MNITKKLLTAIVPATIAFALMAGPALAHKHDKKKVEECSPGYYRNHTEECFEFEGGQFVDEGAGILKGDEDGGLAIRPAAVLLDRHNLVGYRRGPIFLTWGGERKIGALI